MLDRIVGDVRYALRTLLHAPAFTTAVVGTMALAVGVTTAAFTLVNAVLLQPLPFPGSERVVALCETNVAVGDWCGASPMNVRDWTRQSRTLESAGVARPETFIGRAGGVAYGIAGAVAGPGFFEVLRVEPLLGRLLEEQDLRRGANRVVVVSQAFWQQRLGGDPAAIGRSTSIDGQPLTVVGVVRADSWLPEGFAQVDAWKALTASVDDVEDRGWRGFTALGRTAAGVSREQLHAELSVIRGRLATAHPEANRDWGFRAVGLREKTVGDVTVLLWTFFAAAGFVLLIASANVAGLLVVRAAGRQEEIALRLSLGAGRWRLGQQLVTESLVIGLSGGALGLLIAVWTAAGFTAVAPDDIPRVNEIGVDGAVVAFAFALTLGVAVLVGLVPARRAWGTSLVGPLKGTRGGHGGDVRLRSAFVVLQLALALSLLFGAGLLTRAAARMMRWEPGFGRETVMTAWMLPPRQRDVRSAVALMERVRDAVALVPGIEAASLASAGPLFGGEETGEVVVPDRPRGKADTGPAAQWFNVDAHYVETLGLRLVRGRRLAVSDTSGAAPVALVNETFARRFFPGGDALGSEVTVRDHRARIVGIVKDVKPLRPDAPTPAQILWPFPQVPRLAAFLVLRTSPTVAGHERAVRARVAAVDPGVQLDRFVTLDERFAARLVAPRFNVLVVGTFAMAAVLLAAVGVYGVVAYAVAGRTRELCLRVALGATPGQLVLSVVTASMRLAIVGIVAGCAGALVIGRVSTNLLYGLPPTDPPTLAAAVIVLALVTLVASWLPARRASRVDPAAAFRAP